MQNLRSRTIKALLWNLSGTGGKLATQLLVQICLARILSPTEFGLMAMLMVATSIGQVFVDGGFGTALVHHKHATREEESSVLYSNIGLSLTVFGIFWFLAPSIAVFYGQPAIDPLLRFSSIGLVIGACGIVQGSILTRNLDFKSLSIVNLLAGLMSGGIAIWMAYHGYGVWSLAWQFVLNTLFRTVLLWIRSEWRPACTFRIGAIRKMGSYGVRLVVSNLISAVFENLNQLLIGKFYTAPDLGHYNRAQTMQSIPVNTFSQAIGGVVMPAFVHLNDQPDKFRQGFRQATRCTMAVALPMMALLCVLAKPIFLILLSAKWLPAVPYFQLFCLSGMLYPLHLLNVNTLLSLGKTDLFLRIEVVKRIVGIGISVAVLPFGVMALAQSTILVGIIYLAINTYYSKTIVGYGLWEQVRDSAPYACNSAIATLSVWIIQFLIPDQPLLQIALGSTGFSIIFIAGTRLIRDNVYSCMSHMHPFMKKY